ncbi:MAG: hypothetical protein WBG30_12175, partial [Psychrilyobacter sp.]|uniref:hypothetical protein n=1 Tax=Psychrilyobacter sp. TaxID=2586924 RepID=UPI003C78FF07
KNTVEDLANLVSSELTKDAIITNSWNDQDKEFIVLAVDKTKISKKAKEIFVIHVQAIIDDLDETITEVSNEYLEISKLPLTLVKETPTLKKTQVKAKVGNKKSSKKNFEPEVFLDDF